MARRMFSPQIVDSDAFLDMPTSAQSLYFHLGMRADDDGFVGNPRKILRAIGGTEDDLKILFAKRFLLTFESGVIVIKHWRINNLIRKDWYKETVYLDEKSQLDIKDNGSYTEKSLVNENVTKLVQVRSRSIGKVRLGKDSLGEVSINLSSEIYELVDLLRDRVTENYPFTKPSTEEQRVSEAKELDRLIRLDQRPLELVRAVVDWATKDPFWRQQIRSVKALRKHFETMLVKIKSTHTPNTLIV